MNPWARAQGAWAEPWRLWTCHAVHYGPGHLLLNLGALAVPFALGPRRWRMALGLFLLAPVLSLALLPFLGDGQYRGASGLACAAWSMAGCALLRERRTRAEGALLLGFLGLKLLVEALSGAPFMPRGPGWVSLPAAHGWGAVLGAGYSPMILMRTRLSRRPSNSP